MSTPSRPLPPKKDVALALLQTSSLFIHLDPRKTEALVPLFFKKQPQLVLQVGMNMAIPIPDLKVDDDGVSCTLSFNRRPFWCRLPWTAIYALVGEDMKGMIWPDEVPSEVAAQRDAKAPQSADATGARGRTAREPKKKVRSLRSAPATAPKGAEPDDTSSDPPPENASSDRPPVEAVAKAAEFAKAAPHAPAPPSSPGARREGARPGKRELPPYLRVVK